VRFKHLYQIHIIHGTAMLRNSVIKENQLKFDPNFKHAEDYDFFDRLGNVSEISNLHKSHYLIRQHDGRVSSQFSEIQWNNSSVVKRRIFQSIGIQPTNLDLELIMWMMYQNYEWFDAEKLDMLVDLINRMNNANSVSAYIEPEFLRNQLVVHFYHLANFFASKGSNVLPLLRQLDGGKFSDEPKLVASIYLKCFKQKLKF